VAVIAATPATVTAALLRSVGERLSCTHQHSPPALRRDAWSAIERA
jgi:hypothetical protein